MAFFVKSVVTPMFFCFFLHVAQILRKYDVISINRCEF